MGLDGSTLNEVLIIDGQDRDLLLTSHFLRVKMELYVNLRRMRRRRDVSLPYSFLFDRPSVQGV